MSDQLTSKAGTITRGEDRFMEWKTKDGNLESKALQILHLSLRAFSRKLACLISSKTLSVLIMMELIPIRFLRAIISISQFARLLSVQELLLTATEKLVSSGILRAPENRFQWFSMHTFCSRQLIRRQSLLLQTAMIWITSFMGSSVIVKIFYDRNLFRQKAENIWNSFLKDVRQTESSLPQCRSSRKVMNRSVTGKISS